MALSSLATTATQNTKRTRPHTQTERSPEHGTATTGTAHMHTGGGGDASTGSLRPPLPLGPGPDTMVLTHAELRQVQALIHGESHPTAVAGTKGVEVTSVPVSLGASGGGAATSASTAHVTRRQLTQSAAEHKAHIQAIDEARRAKGAGGAPKTEGIEAVEREANRQQQTTYARDKLHDEIDEVKYMKQVTLYAKCVTVRDAQVLEKRSIRQERAEEERHMDMMMELERLKALRMYDEREQKRIEDRRKGAAVIRAQIEERDQERQRQRQLKQQEQDAMLRHIERMHDDDRLEATKKKDASRRLLEDVALTNAEQVRLKNRQREMEQLEEQQIAEYLRERERREQEVIDEQQRIKSEKEREVARLRSMQERAQDKQAELDALRARRAQDAYDRDWRRRQKESTERSTAINEDLAQARERQKTDKELCLAEQGRLEKEEFERIVAVQKLAEEAEHIQRERQTDQSRRHAEALSKQISEVEEHRKKSRRDFLEEGNRLKKERHSREALVDSIRQRKLDELESLHVPRQYRHELLRQSTKELRPSM